MPNHLDPSKEEQLLRLARLEGADPPDVARRILEDDLDFVALERDTPEAWAESAAVLAGEVMPPESDDEGPE